VDADREAGARGPTSIGTRTFTSTDQTRFAEWSLDRNPMHMDAVVARRLITGRPVVHGIHVLLCALDLWPNAQGRMPTHVACTFANPISVGDEVLFTERARDDGLVSIDATVDGVSCARVQIGFGPAPVARAFTSGPWPVDLLAPLTAPLDLPPASHTGTRYRIALHDRGIGTAFPHVRSTFGPNSVAAIAALSYVVGMVCPGHHSIFSSVTFAPGDDAQSTGHLDVGVVKYDERVRLFDIAVSGALRGSIKAFLRTPPQQQPSLGELAVHVSRDEFRGTRSLVVGGSRGLGELTAKILAAGGGDVTITYASGRDDALRIQQEIDAHGGGACDVVPLDLSLGGFEAMPFDWGSLTNAFFFATPRIYRRRSDLFDARVFADFSDFYISRFFDLCRRLEAAPGERPIDVFFPSSVFVTDRPKGMTEYAMAKAAGEVLAADITRTFTRVRVRSVRLPRLSTDQTASILKVSTESNVETLVPVVRAFMRGDPGG
jgi:acyl dehydratase/NAD(P)-dependent dehydrogenase (short-subunit alcohol dehydrogenase family)